MARAPHLDDGDVRLFHGDCVEVLRELPEASVDAIVTDPPYGLSREPDMAEVLRHWLAGDDYAHRGSGFMGKSWDSFVPGPAMWREAFRVLKPGGHLVAFSGSRTADLQTTAIRLAGFQIRDSLVWLYAQGFPKSLDISKAIDKAAGTEREVLSTEANWGRTRLEDGKVGYGDYAGEIVRSAPATEDAKRWEGWGSALKPGHEPIVLARKPFPGTLVQNVLERGTGAVNVDGCRIPLGADEDLASEGVGVAIDTRGSGWGFRRTPRDGQLGRWPTNVVFSHDPECRLVGQREVPGSRVDKPANGGMRSGYSGGLGGERGPRGVGDENGMETVAVYDCVPDCPIRMLDEQTGDLKGNPAGARGVDPLGPKHYGKGQGQSWGYGPRVTFGYGDAGGASRFFYTAKADSAEREGSLHPTVKPVALMRWLVRMVTPPGGLVLDPFAGSGTTGLAAREEGMRAVLIERDAGYLADIAHRLRQLSLFG